ncbi:MAG: HTH domain-containing protein [Planctomycetaceae bacterium]|nr:HTH domain-containing protein [Planctomycetaceae bacterium]
MQYERSLEIERRLEHVLRLIKTGRYSTPLLAQEVGVSIPTISRCVCALRERGFDIRSRRHGVSWRYVLIQTKNHSIRDTSGELSGVAG